MRVCVRHLMKYNFLCHLEFIFTTFFSLLQWIKVGVSNPACSCRV